MAHRYGSMKCVLALAKSAFQKNQFYKNIVFAPFCALAYPLAIHGSQGIIFFFFATLPYMCIHFPNLFQVLFLFPGDEVGKVEN